MKKAAASLALAAALTFTAVPAMGMDTTTDGGATGTTATTPGAFGATHTTDSNSMTNAVGTTDTNTAPMGNGTDGARYSPYDTNRAGTDGYTVNNYRSYATNADRTNWSWLGLLGLIGLAGLFGRNRER
ncbi:MAG: hypothetical protein K0R28_3445, partial [Paenibacillus sp.]|nr:hypothetical protein [Paenibacillus sp.]